MIIFLSQYGTFCSRFQCSIFFFFPRNFSFQSDKTVIRRYTLNDDENKPVKTSLNAISFDFTSRVSNDSVRLASDTNRATYPIFSFYRFSFSRVSGKSLQHLSKISRKFLERTNYRKKSRLMLRGVVCDGVPPSDFSRVSKLVLERTIPPTKRTSLARYLSSGELVPWI